MRRRLAVVVALAALAAGCGSGGHNDPPDAASIVPQNALAYGTVNTDLGSDQLSSAKAVLDKFPAGPKVVQMVRSALTKNGVDPAALSSSVGPVVDVAVLTVGADPGVVGFAQPSDEQSFVAQLGAKAVHEQIDGWTVFAESQALLDAVKNRTANLADASDFKAAAATVPGPGDAIATGYVTGAGIRAAAARGAKNAGAGIGSVVGLASANWAEAALTSSDGAVKLELHENSSSASTPASGESLADRLPSGAIAAASLTGSGAAITAGLSKELQALPKALANDLGPVLGALGGPVIAYVRPGAPIPDVTIAAKPAHPAAVAAGAGALIKKLTGSSATPASIGGATMLKVDLGGFALYYGTTADGLVVVTDSATAISELDGKNGKLSDDSGFKDATGAAGLPDDNEGFLYVDVKELLPTVDGLAQLASTPIPAQLEANLKPVDTALVYGSRDGDLTTIVAYAKTR